MTFYEAALRVLESAGQPLSFLEITEKSIAQNLLSHVGKTPEQTMLSRLVAMARRPRDRKVVVTAKDTFALADWALPEDATALAAMAQPEPGPEENQPPLRPVERHPEPRAENVKASGRGADRKRHRREEEEQGQRRKRKYPPIPEVVFEILSEADAGLKPAEIAERARARELASAELGNEQILTALLEDNQRRIDAGRRPQFVLDKATGAVSLEKAGQPSEAPPLELQAAFAQALGIPLEGGRPVLPRSSAPRPVLEETDAGTANQAVRTAAKEARRAVAHTLRARLADLDPGTFEKSAVRMLQGVGFREIKVAKRGKEGPLVTARKREGSLELRFAVRIVRGSPAIDRKTVQDLRRDLGHYAAQVGLLVCAGEVRGDARSEALSSGALVMLWCGDALGEKFLEAKAGVLATQVETFEIDERFFEVARVDAIESLRRREERKGERDAGSPAAGEGMAAAIPLPGPSERTSAPADRPAEGFASAESPLAAVPAAGEALDAEGASEDGDDEEGDEEDLEAASAYVSGGAEGTPGGAPGEPGATGRRRRRRRRGRRGRGPRPGEAGGEGGSASAAPGSNPGGGEAAGGAPVPGPAAAPSAPPSGGEPGPSQG